MPCSAIVGTSGSSGVRVLEVTPRQRSFPCFTSGAEPANCICATSMWPAIRSTVYCAAPL